MTDKKQSEKQRGVIMVYVLLVISLITAIAITVSVVIINELKLTSGAVEANMAYYAAEAGVERGLYGVKTNREANITLAQAITTFQGYLAEGSAAFSNSATYSDAGTTSASSLIVDKEIKMNEYVQADYYNIDNLTAPSEMKSMKVTNVGDNPSAWAEVSWIAWDSNGTLGESTSAKKIIGPTDLHDGMVIHIESSYPNANTTFFPSGYRVRIKALFGDLSGVTVTPYKDDVPNPVVTFEENELPSQVVIKAVGTRGKYKQALTAILPWKMPLAGLYDYVLFSEGEINKTTILSKPIFTSGAIQVEAALTGTCGNKAACQAAGWYATCAASLASCEFGAGNLNTCSIDGTGGANKDFWVLPIPSFVPDADGYYLNFRANYTGAGGLKVISGDTCFNVPKQSNDWISCTIPWPDINKYPGTALRFEAEGATTNLKLDWYQLSTYKLFNDCASVSYCAISQTCPNCECTAGETCPADDASCSLDYNNPVNYCKVPVCTNGCQSVNSPEQSQNIYCGGSSYCCGGVCKILCSNPATDCGVAPACASWTCSGTGCSTSCVADHQCATPDGCCDPACPSDPDCIDREYLRYASRDDDYLDLTTGFAYPGVSMRETNAWNTVSVAGGPAGVNLNDVWATSSTNIWVVGDSGNIWHYNGSKWTNHSRAGVLTPMRSVFGNGTTGVWVVGDSRQAWYYNVATTIWTQMSLPVAATNLNGVWYDRWNGTTWVVGVNNLGNMAAYQCTAATCTLAAPIWNDRSPGLPGGFAGALYDITGFSSADIWVAGGGAAGQGRVLNWNGLAWTTRNGTGALKIVNQVIRSIAGTSNSNLWITGTSVSAGGTGIVYHSTVAGGVANWISEPPNDTSLPAVLYSISLYTENSKTVAITSGTSGKTYYRNTSGIWSRIQQTGNVTNNILGSFALDQANNQAIAWLVGASGTMLTTNLPGSEITISNGSSQYWYSKAYPSFSTKSGQFTAGLNFTRVTGSVPFNISMGYCVNGCGSSGDYTMFDQLLAQSISGVSFVSYPFTKIGSIVCPSSCRLWFKVWNDSPTANSADISVSGRDFNANQLYRNSYLDLP